MINLTMQTQPNDETCGPTCLHAIYNHYGLPLSLDEIISQVERGYSGGTLAPFLGKHALNLGFSTTIYINNLDIFDPTWFSHQGHAKTDLLNKLKAQMQHKKDKGLVQSSQAYQDYIERGGIVKFRTINTPLLKFYFDKQLPILTGLSATYLYRCPRERYTPDGVGIYDDIHGTPCGHFVVLCGYDDLHRRIVIADPAQENPLSHDNYLTEQTTEPEADFYNVTFLRNAPAVEKILKAYGFFEADFKTQDGLMINAIMLGVLTYDANLLIVQPKEK